MDIHAGRAGGENLRLLLSVTLMATVAAACGGGEEGAIEATIRRAVDAYNGGETDAFLALHTDKAIEDEYGLPRDLAAPRVAEFIGQPPIELRRVSNVEVTGAGATVDFEHTEGKVLVLERVTLINDGGGWKLDAFEERPLAVPETATLVGIEMGEFAFALDSRDVRDGNIALTVANIGQQDHEAVVARIAADANLDELVPALAESAEGKTPAGVEEIVAFGAYEPGETGNVIFADRLEPGRYGVFCFFPDVNDPEHTPHALKGMFSEFSIPG